MPDLAYPVKCGCGLWAGWNFFYYGVRYARRCERDERDRLRGRARGRWRLHGRAIGENIFTQADSWDELRANAKEAVQAFYFGSAPPASILLRLVREEVLAVA
jgi:hypothetical protein